MEKREEFELANAAFEQMTLKERAIVLTIFATLKFPSVLDRFFEAVYRVVRSNQAAAIDSPPPAHKETILKDGQSA